VIIDPKKNTVTYTTEELSEVALALRNIRTRSQNAGTVDNTIALNDLAKMMHIQLPEKEKETT